MATFEEVFANLGPKHKKQVSSAMEIAPERLPTPSVGLNIALGGGFGMGRIVTLWGDKSAGKTAIALQTIAEAQANGKVCAFLDVEGTYDSAWAGRLGVDNENILYAPFRSVERVTDVAVDMINAGADIIVIDSITALVPGSYLDEGEFKGFKSTGKIGADAMDTGKMLKSLNMAMEDKNTLVILISQQRMGQKGSMYWGFTKSGGQAVDFYSSQIVRLSSTSGKANMIEDGVAKGDIILQEPSGRKVHWTVEFNKLGPQWGTGDYDFYFQGEKLGVDTVGEIADLAVKYQIVTKAGKWIKYADEQFDGRKELLARLRSDEAFYDKIEGELLGRI